MVLSEMIPSMLIKESRCQTRSGIIEKLAKCGKTHVHHTSHMATPEEKQIDSHTKMEWQMYFSAEKPPGVNPVVINYKIRHNKNRQAMRPARYCLVWPDCFLCYYLWWEKNGKTWSGHERLCAREGLLSVWVSQSMVNRGRPMNITTFSTQDLREQAHKSYEASYQANNEWLVIPQMFSHKLHQWRWFTKASSADDSQYTENYCTQILYV